MARSNSEQVRAGFDLLAQGLWPYISGEMRAFYGEPAWQAVAAQHFHQKNPQHPALSRPVEEWDLAALLSLFMAQWPTVFKRLLSQSDRSYVSEVLDFRNHLSHSAPGVVMETRDALRALDTASRLLESIGRHDLQQQVDALHREVSAQQQQEQVQSQRKRIARQYVSGDQLALTSEGELPYSSDRQPLTAWRDLIYPHADVRNRQFKSAEYAADLWNVFTKGAEAGEYGRPYDFFNRTYLTDGLKSLLGNALERVLGQGGDPVINLQTNFGGGKTHSLLALYHLFSGDSSILGLKLVEELLKANPGLVPREVKRAVIVGNHLVLTGDKKPDGTIVRTIWGEIAWQLGGAEAYALVRAADETATNPGQSMRLVLERFSPCLILIDEWVSYARQLKETAPPEVVAGDFETQFTFAQTLTEQAKTAPGVLLVISLPESDKDNREVGGDRGREALARLANIVGRIESPWKPATTEEAYGIVTSRLFEPIEAANIPKRDAVLKEIQKYYKQNERDFPDRTSSEEYYQRMRKTYPIHPELFEQLSTRWASLETFQRTRGILRLMSKVISEHWDEGSRDPLLMPGSIPLNPQSAIQSELTRYLSSTWQAVLDQDVESESAMPGRLDDKDKRLGRHQLHQRVARALFFATAPMAQSQNRGVDAARIRLATLLPVEKPHLIDDALSALVHSGAYIYSGQSRYWYSTQPNINSIANERRRMYRERGDELEAQVKDRLKSEIQHKSVFGAVHLMPATSGDVPDTMEARLVIFAPGDSHLKQSTGSAARQKAEDYIKQHGNKPRLYQNALVFLAVDHSRLEDLWGKAAEYMAWKSILEDYDKQDLHLDRDQKQQVDEQVKQCLVKLDAAVKESYRWLIYPSQTAGTGANIDWKEQEVRAGKDKLLKATEALVKSLDIVVQEIAPDMLTSEILRPYYFSQNDHIELRTLAEHSYRFLYNFRFSSPEVLYRAAANAPNQVNWAEASFAWASSYDSESGEYQDLHIGQAAHRDCLGGGGLVVKPEAALRQIKAKQAEAVRIEGHVTGAPAVVAEGAERYSTKTLVPPAAPPKTAEKFYGEIAIDSDHLIRRAGKIQEELIEYMVKYGGKNIQIRVVLEATMPAQIDENQKRVIRENARSLGFRYEYD
jgi:predicted AAA+ superfamily ATPase